MSGIPIPPFTALKRDLFFFFSLSLFFFSFPSILYFSLCCLRESWRCVFEGSQWGQQIQMMLDADMEAAVALGALREHHSC